MKEWQPGRRSMTAGPLSSSSSSHLPPTDLGKSRGDMSALDPTVYGSSTGAKRSLDRRATDPDCRPAPLASPLRPPPHRRILHHVDPTHLLEAAAFEDRAGH